jgi:hypothetical protein
VPTWALTQMMLIVLLVLTFTLLPYLTSSFMDALISASAYQRRRCATALVLYIRISLSVRDVCSVYLRPMPVACMHCRQAP